AALRPRCGSRAPGMAASASKNSSTSAVPIDVNDRHMLRAFCAAPCPLKSATSRRKRRRRAATTRRRSTPR
ncbi:hypothetical protein BVW01_21985, partial [Mycobacterium tuberculosis]